MEKQAWSGRANTLASWSSRALSLPTKPSPSIEMRPTEMSLTGLGPAQGRAEVFVLFWQKWGRVCKHKAHPVHVRFSLGLLYIMKDPKFLSMWKTFRLLSMSLFSPLWVILMSTFKLVMCYGNPSICGVHVLKNIHITSLFKYLLFTY